MSSPSRDHSPKERSAKRVRGSRPETDERVAVQWASDEEPDSEADEIVGYSEDGQGLKVNQSTAHFLCAYTDVHVYTLIKMRTQVTHYFEHILIVV